MHWGRKYQSFLRGTLMLGTALGALESAGSVDGSDKTNGELDNY